jgi:hypothetical protein
MAKQLEEKVLKTSERLQYLAVDSVVFKYICSACEIELVIKPGKKLRWGNGQARCPALLWGPHEALDKYREFLAVVDNLSKGMPRGPVAEDESYGTLRLQIIIPDDGSEPKTESKPKPSGDADTELK